VRPVLSAYNNRVNKKILTSNNSHLASRENLELAPSGLVVSDAVNSFDIRKSQVLNQNPKLFSDLGKSFNVMSMPGR